MTNEIRPDTTPDRRLLLADPMGTTARWLVPLGPSLGVAVAVHERAESLARDAAESGAALIVILRPDSAGPLERLRNDPRTRHIPVILATGPLQDEEQRYYAVVGSDQLLDYPYERETLAHWIRQGLANDFRRTGDIRFATAKMREKGAAHWAGRVSAVGEKRIRFETDVILNVGTEVGLEGPLVPLLGLGPLTARVVERSNTDVFYAHAVRLELELVGPAGAASLAPLVRGVSGAAAPLKTRIAVISESGHHLTLMAQSIDNERFALRWIRRFERLPATVQRLKPALLIVDPAHPDTQDPMASGALLRAAKQGTPVLPLRSLVAEQMPYWAKLGAQCPATEVPPLGPDTGWNEVLDRHAGAPPTAATDLTHLRREHPLSHARVTTPVELITLSESGGDVDVPFSVGEQARCRLDIEALIAAGLPPLYGRALAGGMARQAIGMVWMGTGGEAETKSFRHYVNDRIMLSRRQEFERSE